MVASKAQQAATAERRNKAIELRRAGVEWQRIAETLGYSSKAAACKDVTRARDRAQAAVRVSVEHLRQEEIERLDRIQVGLWPAATKGDPKAADTVIRVIRERSRLNGVDVSPDVEERIRGEMTARIGAQMGVVWGRVLGGIPGLTEEQRAAVPGLLDEAIRWFTTTGGRVQAAIEGTVVDDDDGVAA